MAYKELAPGVYAMESKGFVGFAKSFAMAVADEVPCVIDTGVSPEAYAEVVDPKKVELVINSHFHVDHVRYNSEFERGRILSHEDEYRVLTSYDVLVEDLGMSYFGPKGKEMAYAIGYREMRVDEVFMGGQEFDLGRTRVKVVHTPGHTRGHCSFLFPDYGIVYTADIDLTSFGPWYGNPVSNLDDFIASIDLIKSLEPEVVVSGHVGVVDQDIQARLEAYKDIIFEREEKIYQALREPHNLAELAALQIAYGGRSPGPIFDAFEQGMVKAHLDRLLRSGRISRVGEDRFIQT